MKFNLAPIQSMSDSVIRVENLSKKYIIRHQQAQQYTALRDVIADGIKSIGRRLSSVKQDPSMSSTQEEFWALKDVSFEVKQGDRIGIIGRNGAGKSTLLKILSRIVEPTTGEITLNGRVASLLEVGTGFHPELTGRENIYLNGAVLGMNRLEIRKKFDEIVDFAGVEKFLDTPVKRYSSGMYVRLAFAVAAHLEPEIMIVDEVLAVGDIQFQKKCLGKMEEVASQKGRSVIFVSHNMSAIRNLCNRAILLDRGSITENSSFEAALSKYLNLGSIFSGSWKREINTDPENKIRILEVKIINMDGKKSGYISSSEPFSIEIEFYSQETINNAQIHVRLTNQEGVAILTTSNVDANPEENCIQEGIHSYRIDIPSSFLPPSVYSLIVAAIIPTKKIFDIVDSKISFSIEDMGNHATKLNDGRLGVITPILIWHHE